MIPTSSSYPFPSPPTNQNHLPESPTRQENEVRSFPWFLIEKLEIVRWSLIIDSVTQTSQNHNENETHQMHDLPSKHRQECHEMLALWTYEHVDCENGSHRFDRDPDHVPPGRRSDYGGANERSTHGGDSSSLETIARRGSTRSGGVTSGLNRITEHGHGDSTN